MKKEIIKKTKMKKIVFLILGLIIAFSAKSQVHYKNNEEKTEIYYENIIEFKDKTKKELHELIKKYLIVNNFTILYEDDNDIYTTGKMETKYRSGFKTRPFNCLYDLKISFKDKKVKYLGTNYILIYKNVRLNSYSWFTNPSSLGSSAWSTTKIPTEIPKKPVNLHYIAGKTGERHMLFQDLDKKMSNFDRDLMKIVNEKEGNW